jgi:hypothetical protein
MQIYRPIIPYRNARAWIYILASAEQSVRGIKPLLVQWHWHNHPGLSCLIGSLLSTLDRKISQTRRHSIRYLTTRDLVSGTPGSRRDGIWPPNLRRLNRDLLVQSILTLARNRRWSMSTRKLVLCRNRLVCLSIKTRLDLGIGHG